MALLALTASDGGQELNNSNSCWCLPAGRSLFHDFFVELVVLWWSKFSLKILQVLGIGFLLKFS